MDFNSLNKKTQEKAKAKSNNLPQVRMIEKGPAFNSNSKITQDSKSNNLKSSEHTLAPAIIHKSQEFSSKNNSHSNHPPHSQMEIFKNDSYLAPSKKSKPYKKKGHRRRELSEYERDKLEQFGFQPGECDYLILDNDSSGCDDFYGSFDERDDEIYQEFLEFCENGYYEDSQASNESFDEDLEDSNDEDEEDEEDDEDEEDEDDEEDQGDEEDEEYELDES